MENSFRAIEGCTNEFYLYPRRSFIPLSCFFISLISSLTLNANAFRYQTLSPSKRSRIQLADSMTAKSDEYKEMTPTSAKITHKIAAIGAGAAGLAMARVCSRENNSIFDLTVLEKNAHEGGIWRYDNLQKPHGHPMYRGLRTNLPKEIMAYREWPWTDNLRGVETKDSFVTHVQVLRYLQSYVDQFNLQRLIQRGCEVTELSLYDSQTSSLSPSTESWPKIQLRWKEEVTNTMQVHLFDAVCVCNGHYAQPSIPNILGLNQNFDGQIMHSISYDDPSVFSKNQTILCIGGRASGSDVAREVSQYAKKVYLSDSTCPEFEVDPPKLGNVTWVPRTVAVKEVNRIIFQGNSSSFETSDIDVIIFCSGYDYSFPFITDVKENTCEKLSLQVVRGERKVSPLLDQLWHAQYPNVAFVGLPHSVIPFPLMELQAEAVCHQWLHGTLPTFEERIACATRDAESGGPKDPGRVQDTHYLGRYQWDYCRRIASLANNLTPELERYILTNKAIYDHSECERKGMIPGGLDTYRSTRYERFDGNVDRAFRSWKSEHEQLNNIKSDK